MRAAASQIAAKNVIASSFTVFAPGQAISGVPACTTAMISRLRAMPAARKCANTVPASRMIGISIKKQINGIVFAADDADRDVGKHHEEYADEGDDDAGEKAAALKERRLATSMGPQTAAGIAASTTRSSGPQLTSLTKSMATSDSGSRAAAAIHIGLYQRRAWG